MFHPIAETHHRLQPTSDLDRIAEEAQPPANPQGATTWKPIPLGTIEHSPATITFPSQLTPFSAELPSHVPDKYIERGQGRYVFYALEHLSRDDISDVLQAIKRSGDALSQFAPKVVRAPIYDFCSNHKTIRDIYDYHVSLLDGTNNHIAGGRFIVAAHADWENQGLLLVDFNCQPHEPGKIGIMRVNISFLPECLVWLEGSNEHWASLKAAELDTKWSEPIIGYEGSKWKYYGYEYHEAKWLKGDYGVIRRAT